jgi:hypothetical protein
MDEEVESLEALDSGHEVGFGDSHYLEILSQTRILLYTTAKSQSDAITLKPDLCSPPGDPSHHRAEPPALPLRCRERDESGVGGEGNTA